MSASQAAAAMDKSSSRPPGTDDTAILKTKTTHPPTRPPIKSAAPRLSTGGARPTAASTTSSATKPIGGSSLSKPPARPTTTTTPTVRRPLGTSSTTVAAHQKRQSASSVDEKPSGDEKSKDGISARPKRMSLASNTSTERTATAKSVSATPARRTTIQPSSIRQSATSPTGVKKVPSTPSTARTSTTSRSKPLTSSTSRNIGAGAIGEKKRLSTIPASPAIKSDAEHSGDNKENLDSDVEKKPPTRPALGTRKSTRSVLIEQQIREFELVNNMLQQAIAADGVNDQEQQSINEEAAASIAKLKADLAKVRQFERENGRLPTEGELEDAPEATVIEGVTQNEAPESVAGAEIQNELAEKKVQVDTLQSELLELKKKLEIFSQSADEESLRVQEATEAIRKEHAKKVEELLALHDAKLQELSESHQQELKSASAAQQAEADKIKGQLSQELASKESEAEKLRLELDDLRANNLKQDAVKDAEIEKLKLDLEAKNLEVENASKAVPSPVPSPDHAQELADARRELEAAQSRHEQAKGNAKSKIAKLQEDFDTKVAALEVQHQERLAEVKAKLELAEAENASKASEITQQSEEHAKINGEVSRQGQVIESLKSQVLAFQQSKKDENEAQAVKISKLHADIESLKQEKSAQAEAASATLAAAEEQHFEKITTIENQLASAQEELKNATSAHQEQLEEAVKKAQAEVSAATSELEASKSTHAEKLQALEAQLQKASETATTAEATHEEALSALQVQLDAARAAVDEAATKHETLIREHTSKASSAQEDLAALKLQLDTANIALDEAVSKYEAINKSQEAQASSAQEEVAALKVGHAEQIQQVEEKLHASQKETSSLREAHASQIKQLEQQMQATLKDLDTLEAGHIEQLQRVKTEAADSSQKAYEEAEKIHIQRVRELEQQLNAVEAERSTHARQVEDAEKQAIQDKEHALADLKQSHAESLAALEAQLRSAKEAAEAATVAHTEQLKLLEEDTSSRHAEVINKIKSEHAKELSSIEQKTETAHEEALESLRTSLAEERKALESQSKSAQSDLDNTRFQLQSLKDILSSIEEEGKAKDQEHDEALQKLQDELSMSVRKLAEQSSRIMDLQAHHDQALADAKDAFESKSQEDLETLRAGHEKALDHLQSKLEEQHKQMTDRLQAEHVAAIEAAQTSNQTQLAELERKAKEDLDNQMDEVMKTLEGQWKSQVDQLEQQIAAASVRLAEVTSDHDETLRTLKSEHQLAIDKLEAELQQVRDAEVAPKDTTEVDGLKDQLAEALDQIKEVEKKHSEEMVAALAEHESALAIIKQDLAAAKKAAEQRKDPTEFEELNAKYVEAQKALNEVHEKNEQANRATKAEYEANFEKLLTELNQAKQAAEQIPDTSELDAFRASLEEAKTSISVLQADLEGALLEVETQRSLAENAQKELKQLKQQADVVALPSPKPGRKSRSPKRQSLNPLSPTGAKSGLESSKWATPEEPAAPGLRGGAGDEDETAEAQTEAHPATEKSDKRNVAGQLAGIQEQIRQLDEISEDFLTEHQKMAHTLSKVDDQTQTGTTVDVDTED